MSSTLVKGKWLPLWRFMIALVLGTTMFLPAAPAPAQAATVTQNWVNLLCKFPDFTGIEFPEHSYFQNLWANQEPGLDHYWREASYGALSVDGQRVVGPLTLPRTLAEYEPYNEAQMNQLRDDCIALANPQVDFRQYDGIAIVHNDGGHIGFDRGFHYQLTLDGASKDFKVIWMHRGSDQSQWAHELGHTFGLYHSSGLGYPNQPYTHPRSDYMSDWDLMSGRGSPCGLYGTCLGVHPLVAQKDFLNWIPTDRKQLVPMDSAATVSLERLALPGASGELMVKVPIGGSSTQYYTVEARRFTGYDHGNVFSHIPLEGVVISKVNTQVVPRVRVADSDNDAQVNDDSAAWLPGETYVDAQNAITIKVLREHATGYDVFVSNQPFMTIDNLSVTEPAPNGAASALVNVRLSRPSGATILVDYATRNNDAAAPARLHRHLGHPVVPAGTTVRQVSVPIKGDALADGGERFFVDLSNARNVQLTDAVGQVTIEDPALPALSISNATVAEGNSGTRNMSFTVTLSKVPSLPVSVNYATSAINTTATPGSDYTETSGSLQFASGTTSLTRTVNVVVRGDFVDENNETLKLNLTGAVNASVADAQGIGTITDDDLPIVDPPACPPSLPNCQPQ